MQWLHLALGATAVDAFPRVFEALNAQHEARDVAKAGCSISKLCNTKVEVSDAEAHIPSSPNAFTVASKARSNCGEIGVCDTFNAAEQYVSTSGNNAFRSPGYYDVSTTFLVVLLSGWMMLMTAIVAPWSLPRPECRRKPWV